jgi:N-acetylglucosaminyl-diphospho-decaprenol L-rhamnosyltransferase
LHPGIAVRHLGGHSTGPAYHGEPYALLARRRREVVETNLGAAARRRDDAAQIATFATRALAGRPGARERLRAQLERT